MKRKRISGRKRRRKSQSSEQLVRHDPKVGGWVSFCGHPKEDEKELLSKKKSNEREGFKSGQKGRRKGVKKEEKTQKL